MKRNSDQEKRKGIAFHFFFFVSSRSVCLNVPPLNIDYENRMLLLIL